MEAVKVKDFVLEVPNFVQTPKKKQITQAKYVLEELLIETK